MRGDVTTDIWVSVNGKTYVVRDIHPYAAIPRVFKMYHGLDLTEDNVEWWYEVYHKKGEKL
jgi:hypothetical protein